MVGLPWQTSGFNVIRFDRFTTKLGTDRIQCQIILADFNGDKTAVFRLGQEIATFKKRRTPFLSHNVILNLIQNRKPRQDQN